MKLKKLSENGEFNMQQTSEEQAYDITGEATEGLLLIAILAQEPLRAAALRELRVRKALRRNSDFQELYMTNLSVAAC
jgi:hypothetical protein